MKAKDIQGQVLTTYVNLRLGIAILSMALPIILGVGGYRLANCPLQGSMSAYYHCGTGAMRDVFIGFLFAIGVSLWLYKGVTWLENAALNLAAVFLLGVALFPMQWECGETCSKLSLHGTFAVAFFFLIAYVCIFRSADTLSLISEQSRAQRYRAVYRILGFAMMAAPLIAMMLTWVLQPDSKARSTIFFTEAVGVYVFSCYWIIKTRELLLSGYDRLASEHKLTTREYRWADILKPVSVDRVEHDVIQHG